MAVRRPDTEVEPAVRLRGPELGEHLRRCHSTVRGHRHETQRDQGRGPVDTLARLRRNAAKVPIVLRPPTGYTVAIVTGASVGVGSEIVWDLAMCGYAVVVGGSA